MVEIPFLMVVLGAAAVYFWHQRSREDEALPEYASALSALANRRESSGAPAREVENLREISLAVYAVSGKIANELSNERREELRRHLGSASSPFLIEEAGLVPGTPRFRHTYAGVFRKMGKLSK